jgi:hypothetical protein
MCNPTIRQIDKIILDNNVSHQSLKFFCEGQESILGFMDHSSSVAPAQLCFCAKAARQWLTYLFFS